MMSEPMCRTPASESPISASASARMSVLNAMMTLCRGSDEASALRTSRRLTLPIEASLIGISLLPSSLASASSPPMVSDLMHTPSSSSSMERLDSSSAAAIAATRSSSELTTRRVVPTRTPSSEEALILTPAAA